MKYGLIVFKETGNLGDDILSYSARRFLPSLDYIIDREELDTFVPDKKEFVSVIFNGWYLYLKFNWPPSPYLLPYFTGVHFTENDFLGIQDEYLQGEGKSYLDTYSPIGCRDKHTVSLLRKHDINAYFSGCLTLTINPFSDIQKSNEIYLVDVPSRVEEKINYLVFKDKELKKESHNINKDCRNKSWKERETLVEDYLKKYQRASCVITTRLHAALPCLAMGTPVLLIHKDDKDYQDRISTYEDYLWHCSEEDYLNGKVNFDINNPPKNKDNYKDLRHKLIKSVNENILKVKTNLFDLEGLPDPEVFSNIWCERIKWQKDLLRDKRWLLVDQLEEQVRWGKELIKSQEWLKEQNENLNCRIEELKSWIKQLEDGKAFLESEKLRLQIEIDEIKNSLNKTNKEYMKMREKYDKLTKDYFIDKLIKIRRLDK